MHKGSNITGASQLPVVGFLGTLFTAQLYATGCKLKLLRLLSELTDSKSVSLSPLLVLRCHGFKYVRVLMAPKHPPPALKPLP